MKSLLTLFTILLFFLSITDAQTITCDQAKDSIGKEVTVCSLVTGTHFAVNTKGQPTFINMCEPYPNAPFTVIVWSDVKMSYDPSTLKGKTICVSGRIKNYNGKPEIEILEEKQIDIK